ncbi:NAD(P)H-dependent oxidoreductase [Sutcliffiella horikoshii]|uniref:NAD(P)H-dependent oxidoreductase n=1 Tax=Sutcliffiella horikoshii TaxID=79883 RepID=A0A5D4T6E7_9BACI|nr:NAD(P)H-dependent oxidoreductase [Sutcliffiella horikoshii]TYS69776.1 NAD(P)H-dependent oxidoreductase [Sutcliffiella horikoshii]
MLKIVSICGSLRKDSFNKMLLEAIKQESKEVGDMEITIVEIDKLPLFNEDLEIGGDPVEVIDFKEKLREADGILIVTPEYNSGIPGGLKNALDWASRPIQSSIFANLPVAVAGATPGSIGTALSQMQLRQILVAMNANVMSGPKVLVGGVHQKVDSETKQIIDQRTISHLRSFANQLKDFVMMYKKEKNK